MDSRTNKNYGEMQKNTLMIRPAAETSGWPIDQLIGGTWIDVARHVPLPGCEPRDKGRGADRASDL